MIRSTRFAATAAAMVLLAAPAFAQQAAQPSASHLALARDVATVAGVTRSFDTIVEPMLTQLKQMNVTRPEIKSDLDQVAEGLKPELEQQKQVMINTTARIFASRMSEAELKDTLAFFKTPAGSKYVQMQPVILDEVVRELAGWSQNVSEYIMIRARAEMKKRGHDLH